MFPIFLICVIIGIIIGATAAKIVLHAESTGVLRVNTTDPDGPYLFLDLSSEPYGVQKIMNKEYITMRVDISRK